MTDIVKKKESDLPIPLGVLRVQVRGVVRGGATGAMAPPRFGGWAPVKVILGPWPHLVLEAGPTSVKNLTTPLLKRTYTDS